MSSQASEMLNIRTQLSSDFTTWSYVHQTSPQFRVSDHVDCHFWYVDFYAHVRNGFIRIITTERERNLDIQKNSIGSYAIDATNIPEYSNYGLIKSCNIYVVPIYAGRQKRTDFDRVYNERTVWRIQFKVWKS